MGINLFSSVGKEPTKLQEKALELYDNLVSSYNSSGEKGSGKTVGREEKMVQMLQALEKEFEEPIGIFVDRGNVTPDMVKNRMFSQRKTPQQPTED